MLRNLLILAGAATMCATAQPAPHDALYQTIASLDAKFFDAYNRCDLASEGSLVSEDLEFYHDQTGLSVGRQNLLDALKQNICGKVRRVLVPGTLEVYPLKGFGAVEICVHRFHHLPHDDPNGIGEAKSIMLWRNQDGKWQMTRVISFDHKTATK